MPQARHHRRPRRRPARRPPARAIALGLARAGDGPPPGNRTLLYPAPPVPGVPGPADTWVGTSQAARLLGVSLTTAIRWADNDTSGIEARRDPASSHRLYSVASIRGLLARQSRDAPWPVPDRVRTPGDQPAQP